MRIYTVNQKYVKNKDGDIGVYKKKIRKWIKSNKRYRPQKRGFEKSFIYSTRFGSLDRYNRKEQQELICPSGYSLSQCFNVLRRLWYAYRRAKGTDNDRDKMKKYAKAIQDVQKDMGINTASFPHLGLYGDLFILNDKNGQPLLIEVHSKLKKKQEEYEKWEKEKAEHSNKIQEHLQKPDILKGEYIETFADDVSPANVNFKYEEDELVPNLLEPDIEKGETVLTRTDDVPFYRNLKKPSKKKGKSILTIADDESPSDTGSDHGEDELVPNLLEPDEEKGESILTRPDDIPFQS